MEGKALQKRILSRRRLKKVTASPFRTIILAFVLIILAGAVLLMLPVSSAERTSTGFLTALFTATSATCVTGLSVVETGLYWSAFGQAVILCMIQIGGLGFMTLVTAFFVLFRRRIGLKERMVIAQSYSLMELRDVVSLLKKAVKWTAFFELCGAIILTIRFSYEMSVGYAVWCGVFHSVSAFCNAGFDILGGGSLSAYAADYTVCITVMILISFGGLGFFVWNDIISNRSWKKFSLYTRLVILINAILVFGGFVLFAVLEWNNPGTIGNMDVGGKLLASMFQSVTTRTAGFLSVGQDALRSTSLAVTALLMFIGGASGSTAGGVKTVTFGIVVLSMLAAIRGKSRISVFRRTISNDQARDASGIVALVFLLALLGGIVISATNGLDFSHGFFESVSALGTVGLSTGITPSLNIFSKLLLILYMFFGRVGIMTIGLAFLYGDRAGERYSYAEEKMMIG